jgi:hypothetical protein
MWKAKMITDEQRQQLSPMPYWDDYLCFPQPCWHNIYPGKTTMAEALEIIQADSQLQITSSRDRVITCERVGFGFYAGAYFQSSSRQLGTVTDIFAYETHEYELHMKDAVTIYGTPLSLYYSFGAGPKTDGIYVRFSSNVVACVYDLDNPTTGLIYPDSSIAQIHYGTIIHEIPTEQPWVGYSDVNSSN